MMVSGMLGMKATICSVFKAERLTIYAVDDARNTIVSKIKTSIEKRLKDLILPITPDVSVAGYVAFHKKLVNIKDAYDEKELASHEPPVTFLKTVDERTGYDTRQMLVAPILGPREAELLGVVQIINRKSNRPFPKALEGAVTELCKSLAIAFQKKTLSRAVDA